MHLNKEMKATDTPANLQDLLALVSAALLSMSDTYALLLCVAD
jgi:hypothetical protein